MKLNHLNHIALAISTCLLLTLNASAQTEDASNFGRNALIKPKVGLGGGMFTFFGDVHDNNFSHLLTSSLGYEVMFGRNLSPNFDIELRAVLGKLTINERSLERNYNFSSDIFNGSANIVYNFNNFYSRERSMQPFVSVGIGYLHFDSKTDLYDANGQRYHYWSDGSIRNVAENDPLAETAVLLQRDYEYETDLRKMNLDSLGRYSLNSLSIPINAGFNIKVSPRFNFRVGATFYYNFTDLIDNVSDDGTGVRQGDSKNDHFLFSSATFTYNLWKDDGSSESMEDAYYDELAFDDILFEDSDDDGVTDFYDLCQGTPEGLEVDEKGCPLDKDDDGIRETDEEKNSEMNAIVNTKGVTYTDEMRLAEIEDSLAVPRDMIDVIYPSGVLDPKRDEAAMAAKQQLELDKLGETDVEVPITEQDMNQLIQKASQLQEEIIKSQALDKEFDQISETIKSNKLESPAQIDSVLRTNAAVYKELTKGSEDNTSESGVDIKEQKEQIAIIPLKFKDADLNRDELITAEEVLLIIERFLDGEEIYNLQEIYALVDYYEETMKGARVIDFGGKKGVYINGKLNILPALPDGPANPHKSFLATRFKTADLDRDGIITPDEVNSIIKLYEAGSELYSKEMILELIDLYFEE